MEIVNNDIQEVIVGNNVLFTDTIIPGCNSIIHRAGSGLIKLRGITCGQSRARFRVYFSGNIALPQDGVAPGAITLALSIDGEPVATTRMTVTPGATSNFFNVSTSTFLDVPSGYCYTVGVVNPDGPALEVRNANLIVERVA